MAKEQKDLLYKDLCTRLPYGVKINIKYHDDVWKLLAIYTNGTTYATRDIGYPIETYFEDCKPYLFPMSNMSAEQIDEMQELCDMYDPVHDNDDYKDWGTRLMTKHFMEDEYHFKFNFKLFEFLNKNRLDYRGLIEKGLAIDATGLNVY